MSPTGRLGRYAQQMGAAIFMVEHRYWGNSSPYTDLTTANLQELTLHNAILDHINFARTVKLHWAPDIPSKAEDAPWIFFGCSYAGALSAWTESVASGTFWAYYAGSSVVQAQVDFPQHFYAIQDDMPKNCSKDVNLVIEYMDSVFKGSDRMEIDRLKAMFKLSDLQHNDDVMGALAEGPWEWQNDRAEFYNFCDFVENVRTNSSRPANRTMVVSEDGVGLEKALQGYATWFTSSFIPNLCYTRYRYPEFKGTYNIKCYDTHNASNPIFTDRSLSNTYYRQWYWMVVNEPFGWYQTGAPEGHSTLVSRLVNVAWYDRQYAMMFPPGPNGETYGAARGRTAVDVNKYTRGWEQRKTTRLLYVYGEFDPWRDVTVSAADRPGGPQNSTAQTPILMEPNGGHCAETTVRNATIAQMVSWVAEWPRRPRRSAPLY